MKPSGLKRAGKRLRLLAAFAGLAVVTSGCAIDGGQMITDMVGAGLNSITTSVVNSLSELLARN